MKLSKTSAHAALALAYLAGRASDGYVQARTIADHLHIPTDSALKILQALTRRGILHSQLGRTGGYRLLTDPSRLSLLQIVEAIDGPMVSEMPVHQPHLCEAIDALQHVCDQARDLIRQSLANSTIADLTRHDIAPKAA